MAHDVESPISKKGQKPRFLEFRSSNSFILATVCVAIFTDAFLYGVVVPVLPFSLRDRSGVPEDQVQWWNSFIFAIFGTAILIGSPICGWIADHTSNRSLTYFVGLFVLGGATLLFGLARASWVLLISRMLQGFSAAIVYTVGLALLVDTVGRENVGQWMGMALSSSSFGLIVSPLLGGIVYARAGYGAVFAMAMSLIVVDIVMRLVMIEKKTAKRYLGPKNSVPAENDLYGTFTDDSAREQDAHGDPAPSNGFVPNGHVSTSPRGQPIPADRSTGSPHASPGDGEMADKSRNRSRVPTIIRLLSIPRLLAAMYGIFVNVSVLAAFDGVLPVFVKSTFHWDSLAAGVIFLCLAIPALTGPLVGRLCDKFGPRWITVAGCSLTAPPLILLRLIDHDSLQSKILLCILLTICGFTLILIVSPVAADLSFVVEEKEKEDPGIFGPGGAYAQAFALFNCSMAAATLFGPVLAGWLSQQYGWGTMSVVLGIFAFSGAIPSFFLTGGWVFDKKRDQRTSGAEDEEQDPLMRNHR